MEKMYFKFDTKKRLDEILNGAKVLDARRKELVARLNGKDLSTSEYLAIAEELIDGFEQVQSYKEELDEIAKIEMLRIKMFRGELWQALFLFRDENTYFNEAINYIFQI